MTGVIYARYSSDHQTELSIEAQVRACKEFAEKENITVRTIYKDEAVSGTTANRAGYQAMLSDAITGSFDIILIHKYDRIARDLTEQVTLHERLKALNITLIAVAQNYGTGKDADLSRGIQWVLGSYYSANLSEETKKGHKEIALKGLHNGGYPPFGYDLHDGKYKINELEARYVKRLFETELNGGGFTDIINELDALNIRGKRGAKIKYSQIYEILHNEKYTGTYVYSVDEETNRKDRRTKPNAIRVEDALPAIIDKETFASVQALLKSHERQGIRKHRCSGLVYCSSCGAKMHLLRTKRKGHEYESFICSNHCGAHIVKAEFIDKAVDEYLSLLFSEKNVAELEESLSCLMAKQELRSLSFKEEQRNRIKTAEKELENLSQALASGKFSDNYEFIAKLIKDKQAEITNLKNIKAPTDDRKKVRSWIEDIKKGAYAPRIFIKEIQANTTSVNIISTFTEVVESLGCGGSQHRFPTTMYGHHRTN